MLVCYFLSVFLLGGYRLWCQQKGSTLWEIFDFPQGVPGDEGASGLSFQGFQVGMCLFASGGSQGGPAPPAPVNAASGDSRRRAVTQPSSRLGSVARHDFWWVFRYGLGSFGRIHPRRLWPEAPRRRWVGPLCMPAVKGREGSGAATVFPNVLNGYVSVKARTTSTGGRKDDSGYLKDGGV